MQHHFSLITLLTRYDLVCADARRARLPGRSEADIPTGLLDISLNVRLRWICASARLVNKAAVSTVDNAHETDISHVAFSPAFPIKVSDSMSML